MATRRKRNLNFLPAESRAETVIDISAYPVDIGVGELMRLTRERLGHELQTVANQLRIRLSYLEAIEDARFRDLPGTTYAVGFVRSYADYLGLDGADIVRRFREEAARIHGQTKLVFPALTAEGKLPRAAVLLVSAVGLAAVYGVWYYISSNQHSDLPDVPDRLAVQAPDSGSDGAASDRLIQQSAPEEPQVSSPTAGESPPTTPSAEPSMPAAPADGVTGTASAATPIEPAGGGTAPSPSPPVAPAAAPPAESAPATDIAASAADASPTPSPPDVPSSSQAPAVSSDSATASSGGAGRPSPAAPAASADGAVAPAAPVAEPAPPIAPAAPVAESAPPVAPAAPMAESAPPAAPAVADNEIPAAPAAPEIPGQDASPQVAAAPPAGDAQDVVLEARMECWIKVVDAKGKTVMQKVLKAGESYAVPNQPGLVLRTGNAGGLDVIVGGRKAPALGDVGTVLSKVLLEPSRLLDGTAVTN
jgi:cytoskeletal protein RodZ